MGFSLRIASLLAVPASLSACATEKFEGCPELNPSIARSGDAVVIGEVHAESQGSSDRTVTPPWVSSLHEVTPLRTVKSSLGRIPNPFTAIGKIYVFVPTNDVYGTVYVEVDTISVMVMKKAVDLSADYARYELVYGPTCANLPPTIGK